jgi:L-ribulose-5-phosphate 3-epimerase
MESRVTTIGIMQGRLVPPVENRIQAFPRGQWAEEFPLAAEAGLDCIEWIYDAYGEDVNPLGSAEGTARLRELVNEHGVSLRSVCADYFMDYPLLRATPGEIAERLDRLAWLLGQCQQVGITRMVLPFVDSSALRTPAEEGEVIEVLWRALPSAEQHGVELHLEADLPPARFQNLLAQVSHPLLKVNYDSGNSASLGYDPREEFAAYGERIGSVHIKDRVIGGGTVPLGQGDADFEAVFDSLRALRYSGDFVLQVARGQSGAEVAWARQNKAFVAKHWSSAM